MIRPASGDTNSSGPVSPIMDAPPRPPRPAMLPTLGGGSLDMNSIIDINILDRRQVIDRRRQVVHQPLRRHSLAAQYLHRARQVVHRLLRQLRSRIGVGYPPLENLDP